MATDVCRQITELSAKWLADGDFAHRQLYCLSVGDDFVEQSARLISQDEAAAFRENYSKLGRSKDETIMCVASCMVENVDVSVQVLDTVCTRRPLVDVMWRPPSCYEDCCIDGLIVDLFDRSAKGCTCECFVFATGEMWCEDGALDWPEPSCVVYRGE